MLVLPSASRLEAFGIVLLEAMACKTPVLAYDTPGLNEVARDGGG
jgi:glycosyltransferase involved in cell wall biosynthesis